MSSRKHRIGRNVILGLAVVALVAAAGVADASAQIRAPQFRASVTITNITANQIFSPPLVVSHDKRAALFTLGEPASEELAMLAEDGMTGPLADLLDGATGILDVAAADGMVFPGESVTVEVDITPQQSLISLAGMLVSSNDAFLAIDSVGVQVRGNRPFRLVTAARAYDAGSEANTESCEHIPGPPCGNPGVRVPEGSEGFVYVHSGIHGVADLDAATYDWQNPVALVTIERAN
jgi:hypothetical protein